MTVRQILSNAELSTRSRLEKLSIELNNKEQELVQSGQGLAEKRIELKQRQEVLPEEIARVERSLQALCEGVLPFSLCPILCQELLDQLENETLLDHWQKTHTDITSALNIAAERLTRSTFTRRQGWDKAMQAAVRDELKKLSSQYSEMPSNFRKVHIYHGLTAHDHVKLQTIIREAQESVPGNIRKLSKELSSLESQLRLTQQHLNKAPAMDEVAPLVKELSKIHLESERLNIERQLEGLHAAKRSIHNYRESALCDIR